MKGKILFASILTAFILLAFAPAVNSAANVEAYGYTDKPQFMPGETVTLKLSIYNYGPDEIVLKNVSIYYPWYSPIWDGNQTIKTIDAVLSKDKNWNRTVTFSIPTDGRAYGGSITVEFTYTIGVTVYTRTRYISLSVASVPAYFSLRDMDKLLTMFTVETVLLIVGFLVVTMAIFLSARRPKVTWKAPEEKE